MGLGNDPRYNSLAAFQPFPFPHGLTPRDTAHQRTARLADGAVIPAGLAPSPLAGEGGGEGYGEKESYDGSAKAPPPHPSPLPQGERGPEAVIASLAQTRGQAIAIARAAKRLNDLREAWLNPPEWTERVPEVTPLGMNASPYPDRILPKASLKAVDLKALGKRTLTHLYNERPSWLANAQAARDVAVAVAYGWTDFSAATTDDDILARLLALNLVRTKALV